MKRIALALALVGSLSSLPARAAGPIVAQCYVLTRPGAGPSSCVATFAPPTDARKATVHGSFHVAAPIAGSLTIEWIGYGGTRYVTWDCAPAALAAPDATADAAAGLCTRTDHISPIIPYRTQRIRVTASSLACPATNGVADACSAHGKLTFR